MTVGAGITVGVLFGDIFLILGMTLGVMLVKGIVLYLLGMLFRLPTADRWLFTLALAQAGEFGFVLLSFSLQNHVIPLELAQTLSLVVALSMLLTPALFIVYEKLLLPRLDGTDDREADDIDREGCVIIAGIGRFGQIVNRMLAAAKVQTIVLDHEASIIDRLRMVGVQSFYGDASRPDLLHAAGIEEAKLLVVAIDDRERAVQMVEHVKRNYPDVKVLVRAYDVNHLYLLKKAGADVVVREMFNGSTELAEEALKLLGMHPFRVRKMAEAFVDHDFEGLKDRYAVWDEDVDFSKNKAFLARAREHGERLQESMESDRIQFHDRTERGWTPPPSDYADDFKDED